ncbi:MAG TPA: amino acid adenylation domain-containing protein, partial [Longimicrobiaceae bacterium]|nr:amino acid adenylation domain-containing protein [Longimicrobiaceae bacterium]
MTMPVDQTVALPLSFAQERLWFLDRLQPGSPLYNIPAVLRLTGRLDERALERALGEIVARHEALRTVFREVDGAPVQVISPSMDFALPVEDLAHLDEAERTAEARRRATEDAEKPFDLAEGPLFRVSLLRLAPEDYSLLLTIHHIVGDGWSTGVFFHELSKLYEAYSEGRESPLPELEVQYGDFAVWQREQLQGETLDRELAWWKERLSGAPELLELPTDHPRPAVQTYRGAHERVELPADLPARLTALARGERATLFMVMLGAFQVLLSRHAASEDVVVGSPIAGRTQKELEGLIGFFVNTLVLRTDLSGDPTFRETVRRVRAVTLGAYEHQEVPFERLVGEIQPERSLSHAPLFQVMFSLQNTDPSLDDLPGVKMQGVEAELHTAKFDLSLSLTLGKRGLRASLAYSTDLFERGTARRMLAHYRRVLERVVADPDVRLSELDLLGEGERGLVLEEWNRTEAGYPSGLCVHQLFEAQAARTPDAAALVWGGERITYAELDARADRLARHLRGLGVGPESRVGICLPRTPGMVAALLAVLKAGGAYVPLDPEYPRERLGCMLEDAGARLVLTESALAGRLPAGAGAVCLDELARAPGDPPAGDPGSGAGPENLSHVIFTSGSTGRPKGGMIRHSSVVVLLHWLRDAVTDEERRAVLFATSISFDVSVAELFGTLCWGGTLHLAENALALAEMRDAGIVYAGMVPTAAAELLRTGAIPPSVRTLNLAGEALPAALARGLYEHGVERVGNAYGPTEDTTYSTYARVPRGAERVTVGRPIADTRAYVLDGGLSPVPVGIPGELYLAGDGTARGYAGRPDLTAERFLPDPHSVRPGARMYRVMDRMRWTPAGELEYLGRTDAQVKVRGFRIEPGEIESTLLRHPGVRSAVAVAREDVPGERRLVAYVVPADAAPDAAGLRAHLRRHLPEYMVPGAFVLLETLPLTPGGKLDRRALPAPEHAGDEDGLVAPRTPTEELLA